MMWDLNREHSSRGVTMLIFINLCTVGIVFMLLNSHEKLAFAQKRLEKMLMTESMVKNWQFLIEELLKLSHNVVST